MPLVGHAIGTTRLDRILDLSPGDLTCTVESGLTLRDLDAAIAPHGLCFPVDPPEYAGRATVGGILASNDNGPLRAAHGTAREHVLGMSVVLAGGLLIKAGGRVVKNVAGYDLHRAFVGSHGSLGLIASVSLKLRPRSESRRLLTLRPASLDEAEAWTADVLNGPTRPSILDWLRDAAGRLQLIVGYDDAREAVDWQVDDATATYPGAEPHNEPVSSALYESLRNRNIVAGDRPFRAALPPARLRDFFAEAPPTIPLQAHATGAMVHGSAANLADDNWASLRNFVVQCGGWIDWRDARGTRHWDRPCDPTVVALESRLKLAFDPDSVFAPAPFASPYDPA